MKNLRKRRRIELIGCEEKLRKRVAQPSFVNFNIIHPELVAVERKIVNLKLNRPIYNGFCVLDLSKLHMYNFHCLHIKQLYPGPQS